MNWFDRLGCKIFGSRSALWGHWWYAYSWASLSNRIYIRCDKCGAEEVRRFYEHED